ncbi:MAG: ABC transporter ATP-binding protein/permease [Oscillospiraceae bacterium]|jgi:ATP-binding cassette subfamily B protein|nr:ABC transporter ATP-binding protein/permease [Oscillospiraceae bacterium]
MHNLIFLLKPWWRHGKLMLVLYAVGAIVLSPIAGYFSATLAQAVIERVQLGGAFGDALTVALQCLAISLVCTLLKVLNEDFYFRWKRQEIEGKLEREIYAQALRTDYKYIDNPEYYDSYKLATEAFVSKSSETMEQFITFLGEIARFAVFGTVIAVRGVVIFAVILACAIFAAIAQMYWSRVSAERNRAVIKPRRRTDYLRRLFFDPTSVADMRVSSIKAPLFNSFDRSVQGFVKNYKQYAPKEFLIDIFSTIAGLGATFAVPVYVAWGILTGRMESIGVFATLIAASGSLRTTLDGLGWWSSQLVLNAEYAEQVRAFFDIQSEIEPSEGGLSVPDGAFSVELRDVSFGYPNSAFALKSLNIRIAPNEKIAIVGENGAGKTTLSKLLLRLYDVDDGAILYNGRAIGEYNVHALRTRIGVAFQEPHIYALTVRENMTAYRASDDEKLRRTLESVGLDIALDDEVTREFDESGVMLSGGERQKLGLSRLLYNDFGLLLLDEPSSALDPLAEYKLSKLIFEQAKTTTIIVAHRLSTIRDADRIYLLSNGEVKESGTHDELIALGGKYAEMFAKQAEGYV